MQELSFFDVIDAHLRLKLLNMAQTDESWMQKALDTAREAEVIGEVPVGAVIVGVDGYFLASASNRTIINSDPTAHAEILALRIAASKIGNYRLTGCTIYTTIEPCVMCAGALVNARISRLVFGSRDERFGAVVTKFRLCDSEVLNHRMEIVEGILGNACRSLMQQFFQRRREG